MGQIDYDQIYYLQGRVNAYSTSISSAQSRITSIDEKLERLRTAKKSVGEIQKRFMILKKRLLGKIISLLGKANKRMISPSSGKASPVTTRVFKRR